MKNHNPKPIDLSKKLKPYENQWVAVSLDHKKILGAGKTLKETEHQAKKTGKGYLFLKVLPFNISYVPTN